MTKSHVTIIFRQLKAHGVTWEPVLAFPGYDANEARTAMAQLPQQHYWYRLESVELWTP